MSKERANIKKEKKPWPTKDAMEQIYDKNLWGGEVTYYSGEGSHDLLIIQPYINAVTSFLTSFKTPLIVCDLGCGDFNVGKELIPYTKKYYAIDIVSDLIIYHKKTFKTTQVEFHCLDISQDDLPLGDCAIVRQVLQHLSNAEVQRILVKLASFRYVILTEHLPEGDFIPNKDIIAGQGTRLKKQSGLDIVAAPFYFKVKETKILSAVILPNSKGIIITSLYTLF